MRALYTVDGGSAQPFSSNPFTITGLSAYTYHSSLCYRRSLCVEYFGWYKNSCDDRPYYNSRFLFGCFQWYGIYFTIRWRCPLPRNLYGWWGAPGLILPIHSPLPGLQQVTICCSTCNSNLLYLYRYSDQCRNRFNHYRIGNNYRSILYREQWYSHDHINRNRSYTGNIYGWWWFTTVIHNESVYHYRSCGR